MFSTLTVQETSGLTMTGWLSFRSLRSLQQANRTPNTFGILESFPRCYGSEFLNWHLGGWCAKHQIQFTRGRPYKKDDNAHVEQKNWTHVRKLLGWDRYDSAPAVEAINDLYRHELRLYLNLYLPSVKLVRKVRVGSKLRRVYDHAQTPCQRVIASGLADPDRVASLQALMHDLDPFAVAQTIDQKLQRIDTLSNRRWSPQPARRGSVTFLTTRQLDPGLHP
jgi:hypothetical protein